MDKQRIERLIKDYQEIRALEERIDEFVYKIYGINADERKLIEGIDIK